jgi:hypothetical protein
MNEPASFWHPALALCSAQARKVDVNLVLRVIADTVATCEVAAKLTLVRTVITPFFFFERVQSTALSEHNTRAVAHCSFSVGRLTALL